MKFIITILLLTIGAFAQNTKYKDGADCNCDSISIQYRIESNQIYKEIPYKNGKLNGVIKAYRINGELFYEVNYINNVYQSEIWYYQGGNIDNKMTINERTTFYKTGAVLAIIPSKNGDAHGIAKWYFENGKLAGTATYKDGKLVGYKKCTDGRFGNELLDCLN